MTRKMMKIQTTIPMMEMMMEIASSPRKRAVAPKTISKKTIELLNERTVATASQQKKAMAVIFFSFFFFSYYVYLKWIPLCNAVA